MLGTKGAIEDLTVIRRILKHLEAQIDTAAATPTPQTRATPHGNIRYQLKTPYRDGTTHVIFEPLDFIARLSALVPKPRVNLTRFHGVFAPHSKHRALVTPAGRGMGKAVRGTRSADERRAAMSLKRGA